MATAQPPFSSPSIRSAGTTTSSKNTSANSSSPLSISRGATVIPGVSMSTKNAVMPRWRESAGPVRVSSTQRSENWARLVQTFWPLITHLEAVLASPPSGTARQRRDARSLPESGSENPWHQSSAPESRRGTTSAASSGGAKSMSVGASTSINEKRPGSARSRAARAAPSSVRSIGEPPRPPTRSGHPSCIQPASNRIDFTRCIWATRSSSVPGGGYRGASSSWFASSHAWSSAR